MSHPPSLGSHRFVRAASQWWYPIGCRSHRGWPWWEPQFCGWKRNGPVNSPGAKGKKTSPFSNGWIQHFLYVKSPIFDNGEINYFYIFFYRFLCKISVFHGQINDFFLWPRSSSQTVNVYQTFWDLRRSPWERPQFWWTQAVCKDVWLVAIARCFSRTSEKKSEEKHLKYPQIFSIFTPCDVRSSSFFKIYVSSRRGPIGPIGVP